MTRQPVPAAVYLAAMRTYIGAESGDDGFRPWAQLRWPNRPLPADPYGLAFWVLSTAAQDGRE